MTSGVSDKQINPAELENLLLRSCRFVGEICVVPVPGSELLHAIAVPDFVEARHHRLVFISDRIRFDIENASRQLPEWRRVRSFEVRRQPLPRDSSGELLRDVIEQSLFACHDRIEESPFTDEPEVFSLIRALKKHAKAIGRDTSLELDLGVDSLDRTLLLSAVEAHYGITLSSEQMAGILTAGDLTESVRNQPSRPAATPQSWTEILNRPLSPDQGQMASEYLRRDIFLEPLCFFATRILQMIARVVFSLKIEGAANLPRGTFILCANHASYLDIFFLTLALPFHVIRRLFFFGTARHSTSTLTRWVWRTLRGISIDENADLKTPLRLGAEGLKRGLVLCIFPEGHRSIDGKLRPFRNGAAILAAECAVPLVPVSIVGAGKVLGRASGKLRICKVRVVFGEPCTPEPGAAYDQVTRLTYAAVRKNLTARDQEFL